MQPGNQRDIGLLLTMLVTSRKALTFAEGVSAESFAGNEQLQFALGMAVQVVGESANGVSVEMRNRLPEIPWHKVVGMRHRIAHDYMNVEMERLWVTVTRDLPVLIAAIEPLIPPDDESEPRAT